MNKQAKIKIFIILLFLIIGISVFVLAGSLWNEETTLTESPGSLHSIDFSDDNKWIAYTGSSSGNQTFVHNVSNWLFNANLTDIADEMRILKFSHNGEFLAVGNFNEHLPAKIYIYNTTNWSLTQIINFTGDGLFSDRLLGIDWSYDNQYIAFGGYNKVVSVYNVSDWSFNVNLTDSTSTIKSVSFSPDGNYLAFGGADSRCFVYNVSDWSFNVNLSDADDINSIAFSNNSDWLATGGNNNTISIYNTTSWINIINFTDAANDIYAIAFSPNNNWIAYGGLGQNITIRTQSTWIQEVNITNNATITSIDFSSDNNWLAFSDIVGIVYIYNVTIDVDYPQINITYPLNNTYTPNTTIEINFTSNDANHNLQSCWWSNSSGGFNNSITCGDNITTITWEEGNTNVTIYANDSSGNIGESVVTFTIDTINPRTNIIYPLNSTFTTNTTVEVNYTTTDLNLQSCEWTNTSGLINYTITCGSNITNITWEEGNQNVTVYTNDSAGNTNLSQVTFTVDTIKPNLTIGAITTIQGSQTITFNSTVQDNNLDTCWYSVYNSSGDIDSSTIANTTFSCNVNRQETVSAYGTYTLEVYVNDSANNQNSSTKSFTTSPSSTPPSGGGGTPPTPDKYPVIAIIQPENATEQTDIRRAVLYKEFRDYCGVSELSFFNVGKDSCSLSIEEKYDLIKTLEEKINIGMNELDLWIESYNNGEFENIYLTQSVIDDYDFKIEWVRYKEQPFLINPVMLDTPFIILRGDTFEFTIQSSEELKSVKLLEYELGLSIEQTSDTTAKVIYKLPTFPPDYTTKIITGTANYISKDGKSVFQNIQIRAIYLGPKLIIFILVIFGVIILIFKSKIKKKLFK